MARFRASLCLIFLSLSWSLTSPDRAGKNLLGSIKAAVESAIGAVNFGLVNFSAARGLAAESISKDSSESKHLSRSEGTELDKDQYEISNFSWN
ncbi:conserved hypothetical protein [Ricinus communis]|uniref:Uncharacterized protein n=1 Tax=Ricinus communis TaxID=3988 RepID=B9S973_RICCO|nr:conserved hypothetical protein [Ricinus communis]